MEQKYLGAIPIIIGIGILLYVIWWVRERQLKKKHLQDFVGTFGVEPVKNQHGRLIVQTIVDNKLTYLARHVECAEKKESHIVEPYTTGARLNQSPEEDLKEWKEIFVALEVARDKFWWAQYVAITNGFTAESCSEYLTDEARERFPNSLMEI